MQECEDDSVAWLSRRAGQFRLLPGGTLLKQPLNCLQQLDGAKYYDTDSIVLLPLSDSTDRNLYTNLSALIKPYEVIIISVATQQVSPSFTQLVFFIRMRTFHVAIFQSCSSVGHSAQALIRELPSAPTQTKRWPSISGTTTTSMAQRPFLPAPVRMIRMTLPPAV